MTAKHKPAVAESLTASPIAILDTPLTLTALEKCLLNEYQRGFPLCASPFAADRRTAGCD